MEFDMIRYVQQYDEPFFNTMLILLSTVGIKYIDENISCRRLDIMNKNSYQTFHTLVYSCQDFIRASYGNDHGCVQWSNAVKFTMLSTTILGLIYQINYLDKYLKSRDFVKMHTLLTLTKRSLIGIIVSNYSAQLYTFFLNTQIGQLLYTGTLTYLVYFFQQSSSLMMSNTTSTSCLILKKLIPNMHWITYVLPDMRSRFLLDRFYNLFKINYKKLS